MTQEELSPAARTLALLSTVPGANVINMAIKPMGYKLGDVAYRTLKDLEKTYVMQGRDVTGWVIGDTVSEFTDSFSPKNNMNKLTDNINTTFRSAAQSSAQYVKGLY